jgi:hypothetical protein
MINCSMGMGYFLTFVNPKTNPTVIAVCLKCLSVPWAMGGFVF